MTRRNKVKEKENKKIKESDTSVTDGAEVLANAGKLRGRHPDDSLVLGIRDAQVFAVYVHKLHLKICYLVLICSSFNSNFHFINKLLFSPERNNEQNNLFI